MSVSVVFALCVNGVSAIAVGLVSVAAMSVIEVILCERHERKRSFFVQIAWKREITPIVFFCICVFRNFGGYVLCFYP